MLNSHRVLQPDRFLPHLSEPTALVTIGQAPTGEQVSALNMLLLNMAPRET